MDKATIPENRLGTQMALSAIMINIVFLLLLLYSSALIFRSYFLSGGNYSGYLPSSLVFPTMIYLVPLAVILIFSWTLLDYLYVYRKLVDGYVNGARSNALVLGYLQLILGGVIPGILLIICHSVVRDDGESGPPNPLGQD
jgi:hypothetical protein